MSLSLTIVTPETEYFSGPVSSVVLPGTEGQMEALEQHAALVTTLEPGELRYNPTEGEAQHIAVGEGFVEISQHDIHVVTDIAAAEAEIDENDEEAAVARARKALEENKDLANEELAAVRASLAKSLAKLEFKRRHRHR